MREPRAWTLNFGRWAGVHVRVHASFLVLAICTLFLATQSADAGFRWICGAALVLLLISVAVHESGHVLATLRVGGRTDLVTLSPLGGFWQGFLPRDPHCELLVALAGPTANLAVCLVCAAILMVVEKADLVGLLHPLHPKGIDLTTLSVAEIRELVLKLTFWLNWLLALVNFLPARPFDGGRMLHAILWPALGYRTAALTVARLATVTAFVLCLVAWALAANHVPPSWSWLALVLLAVLIYFAAGTESNRSESEPAEDGVLGYDFSQGYTSLQRDESATRHERHTGLVQQWLSRRRAVRERMRLEQEKAEEARVDAILARLHETGIDRLSPEDRALLHRVSARYRNRMNP